MKSRASLGLATSAIALAIVPMLAGPGLAGTRTVGEDSTDNSITFEYDSSSGTIESATSAERRARNDAVTFRVSILETEDMGSGLLGKLTLRLDADEHTVYDGWFDLHIEDESGNAAFHSSRPVSLHLRPQPGQRRATLRFRLDLPSGDYSAIGSFEDRD